MSITLHTTHGNIKLELFCELCPKASKNFLALAASGKYDNTIFHRNIKGTSRPKQASSFKEETPREQEKKARAYTEVPSKTRSSIASSTTGEGSCRWPTADPTRTAASFLWLTTGCPNSTNSILPLLEYFGNELGHRRVLGLRLDGERTCRWKRQTSKRHKDTQGDSACQPDRLKLTNMIYPEVTPHSLTH